MGKFRTTVSSHAKIKYEKKYKSNNRIIYLVVKEESDTTIIIDGSSWTQQSIKNSTNFN